MDSLLSFLEQHGYWLLAAVGFAEFAGAPIASVPVLIGTGALAAESGLHPVAVAASAAAGGLLADGVWYGIARWRGQRVVGTACGLTSNPKACVLRVRGRVERLGGVYILPVKFIPGAGNLIAAAAGLAGIRPLVFLAFDAAALAAWAGAYTFLGWLLSEEVEAVIALVVRYSSWALWLAVGAVAAASVWRILRARRHERGHAAAGEAAGVGGGPVAGARG